ncbi:hypothetical protein BT63DRAFT_380033 [Microthyrium microscopicum]|uniref:F-box domain-containing protein n=1 Tax=Microthyrium microscopicum TaxID=703497 RepID=A0A6A6TXL2_9PEZI|nr:hypothetical protein BT63DRAFT_380033 [Microthyrium microscopicum]
MDSTNTTWRQTYARQERTRPCFNLDDCNLGTACPLDAGQFAGQSQSSLGQLARFPLETLTEILLGLDIPTLIAFRQVNRYAMSAVDSLPPYRKLRQQCPNILRAALCVQARGYDLRTLEETLQTSKCSQCSEFGDYLYMITCRRICYPCFDDYANREYYTPIHQAHVLRCGISKKDLKHLPSIQSLPGWYGDYEYNNYTYFHTRRYRLFDRTACSSAPNWSHSKHLSAKESDNLTKIKRYSCIISAPYLGLGNKADWGASCAGCRQSEVLYTEEGLHDHFEKLGPVGRGTNNWPCHISPTVQE